MKLAPLTALLVMLTLLSGCFSRVMEQPRDTGSILPMNNQENNDLLKNTKEIEVWSYFDATPLNARFKEKYPDVNVHYTQFSFNEFVDVYLKALISGCPPDILYIDNGAVGQFNSLRDAFDNLLEAPYYAGNYLDRIPSNLHNLYYSFDGKKLIGIPQNMTAAVTFYREDLFRENGLPSEPEEVGRYLENPANWIEAGNQLKQKGISIFQWDTDPLDILAMQDSFFDARYQYVRNTPAVSELLGTSRAVWQNGLSLRASIWTNAGQEALRSGQLAAVYMGSWGVKDLKAWAPETAGKWRVTRLPAGLYGNTGGSILAVPSESRNKLLAWKYIELTTDITKEMHFEEESAFLGGQQISRFFTELPNRTKPPTPSPFDWKAQKIWNAAMIDNLSTSRAPDLVLSDVQVQIEESVAGERKYVLEYLEHHKEQEEGAPAQPARSSGGD